MTDLILEKIKSSRAVRILTHARADGDAIGSAYALARICRALGKQATVSSDGGAPDRLKFLTEEYPATLMAEDLVISVDVASPEQLGALKDEWTDRVDIKIDHHRISPDFGKVRWVDPEAAAAGELVFEIAKAAGVRDSSTADLLYAAISSDTGSFKYSNTSERTFEIARTLKEWGADTARISEKLYENMSVREARADGYIYTNMRFAREGKLAYVIITKKSKDALGTLDEDYGNASSLLRGIEGVELAVAAKENDDGSYKLSTRSKEQVDCAALCARFGGGGHIRAAGATVISDDIEGLILSLGEVLG